MIRLVIADDHTIFREMLRIALTRTGEIEVIAEAGDGHQLLEVLYRAHPDVLLLDYKMPHVRDFRAMVERIHEHYPSIRILVLSGFVTEKMAVDAAAGGVHGYALKSTRLAAVLDAIRSVASGAVWIDPSLSRRVFDIFQRAASGPVAGAEDSGLTRREREVLACVAQGGSNTEVARKLAISDETVKTHLRRIFSKLGVKNRVAAAMMYHGKIVPEMTGTAAAGDPQ